MSADSVLSSSYSNTKTIDRAPRPKKRDMSESKSESEIRHEHVHMPCVQRAPQAVVVGQVCIQSLAYMLV